MKTTKQQYVESYDKQGCLAIVFGLLVLMLVISLAFNAILLMKIKSNEKTIIKATTMEYCTSCCSVKINAEQGKSGVLSYFEMEKGKPAIPQRQSIMCQVQDKGVYSTGGSNRSQGPA